MGDGGELIPVYHFNCTIQELKLLILEKKVVLAR